MPRAKSNPEEESVEEKPVPQKKPTTPQRKATTKRISTAEKQAEESVDRPLEEGLKEILPLDYLALSQEDLAYLEKIKMTINSRLSELLEEIFAPFNIIVKKTFVKDESNNLVMDKKGNPLQDWSNVDISDIKAVLLKIPVIQLRLSSIEVDSWAEAEYAKLIREEYFEKIYNQQKDGTEGAKKNLAYLGSLKENYRAFFLKYANRRIQALNESLTRVTDKWSRVVELLKIELTLTK